MARVKIPFFFFFWVEKRGQDSIVKFNPSGPWSWLGSRFDPQTLSILIAIKCINHVLLERH